MIFILNLMKTKTLIANYSLIRTFQRHTDKIIAFEVTREDAPQLKFQAEMRSINNMISLPKMIEAMRSEGGSGRIEEIFLLTKA
jgi:hypothetical protein